MGGKKIKRVRWTNYFVARTVVNLLKKKERETGKGKPGRE